MSVAYCLYYMVFTAISTVIRDENTTRWAADAKVKNERSQSDS